MAMIERIRNRQGLLMVIIGIGMLGFLVPFDAVMAMMGSGAGSNNAGVIDGQEVSLQDYRIMVENRKALFTYKDGKAAQNEVWGDLVQKMLLSDELEDIGLSVSQEEFDDIRFGDNISPYVRGSFYGGNVTEEAKMNWQATFSQMFTAERAKYEGYSSIIVSKREMEKFDALVKSGILANSLEGKSEYLAGASKVDFEYVLMRYSTTADGDVEVNDSDVKAYYNAHADEARFAQIAGHDIEYVRIPIRASAKDRTNAQAELTATATAWGAATDDAAFMEAAGLSGVYTQSDLKSAQIQREGNSAALTAAAVGEVVGPYFDGDFIRLDRIIARESIADSTVKCRHILLKATNVKDEAEMAVLHARADSIKRRLRAGDSFSDLVNKHTEDPGSKATGGEYEFQRGRMVQSFEDFVFDNKVGHIGTAETNYGLHLIEVLDQQWTAEQVTLGRVSKSLTISGDAAKEAYDVASDFAFENESSEAFREGADAAGYAVVESRGLTRSASGVTGLPRAGEVIGWAFGAETGDVSNPFRIDDDYVIATLVRVKEAGTPPFEFVEDAMRRGAITEKKAEMFTSKMTGSTLEEIATSANGKIETAAGVSLQTPSIPAAGGAEPLVIGIACGLEVGEMRGPIEGQNGVWFVRGKARTEAASKENYDREMGVLNGQRQASATRALIGAITTAADVEDLRSGN